MLKGWHIHFQNYEDAGIPYNWPDYRGFDIIRTHDCGLGWGDIETSAGVYDWTRADAVKAAVLARPVKPLVLWNYYFTPSFWAQGTYNSGYGTGSGDLCDMDAWGDFITAHVARNGDWIEYWGGVNEWGHGLWDVATVTQVQSILHSVVKAYNPDLQVVSADSPHVARISSLYSSIKPYCDIIGHHFYDNVADAATAAASVNAIVNGELPIWDTEFGWHWDVGGAQEMTQRELIDAYNTHIAALEAAGIEAAIMHSWSEHPTLPAQNMGIEKHSGLIAEIVGNFVKPRLGRRVRRD